MPAVVRSTGTVPLNTPENYNQGSPGVAIDSEGDFVVAWESYGQGGMAASVNTLFAQRVNSLGTLIGSIQFTPSTQSGDNQRSPSVANDPYGDTMIVWQSKPGSPSNQDVYGRLYYHVNDAPTINSVSNVSINENAGPAINQSYRHHGGWRRNSETDRDALLNQQFAH